MNSGQTVFTQIISLLSYNDFQSCVARYDGNHRIRRFSCWEQFLAMAFAQLTYRESLRDIEVCLAAHQSKLYHCGFRSAVKRSTLADANETRDWRIFADFAQTLITTARDYYADTDIGLDLEGTLYALDSTTIDLCLSLFPWAWFRRAKGAIKLHTLMQLQGSLPVFLDVTHGKTHDTHGLDLIALPPGSYLVLDRGYLDFRRLYRLHQALSFFVIRSKGNLQYRRRCSHPVDSATGVRSDQTIVLTGPKTAQLYPVPLRRVRYYASEIEKYFIFLTNNFSVPCQTIAALYHSRWQIELFFKWIKQHLRIKAFFGTSLNSVKTQIWIAVATYTLVAIVKKKLNLDHSLYTILQILSLTLFEKKPILSVFSQYDAQIHLLDTGNQLNLFNF